MSTIRLFHPQLLLLLLVLAVSQVTVHAADDPIPLVDGQPAQQLIPPNGTATFTYTPIGSTDSSLYIGLSKDSFTTSLLLYLSYPNQPVNTSRFAYQLPLGEGTDSGSTIQNIQPGNYTLLLVNSDTANNITATLVLSTRSILAVPNTEPVAGSCLAERPLYYSVDVPSPIDNDVILYIQPSNRQSLQYERGLSLYITYGQFPSAANATWSYPQLHWNQTAAIQQNDPALLACPSPCRLYLVVDCVASEAGVQYRITTQEALGLLTVQPNERLPAIQATSPKHYQLFLTTPPTLYIAIELCDGDVTAYLSTTSMYPSTPADSVAYWTRPNSAPTFTLGGGALANYTEYYLNILPSTPSTTYELTVLQFDPAPLAPFIAPSSIALTQATSGSVRFVPPTIASRYNNQPGLDIFYRLYLSDDTVNRTGRVTYTACGVRDSSRVDYMWHQSQSTRNEDGTYELTFPSNTWAATATLVAYLVNTTAATNPLLEAYPLLYTPTTIPAASDESLPNTQRQAVVAAEVIASIFLPLFILACVVAVYLRWRASKLEAELRLELPDVEVNDVNGRPANSAERRQQRRQREREAVAQASRVRDTSTNRTTLLSDDSLSRY